MMRHKNMIKSGIKSLSASKSYFCNSYGGYHQIAIRQHVSQAPSRNLRGCLAPRLPVCARRSTMLQCVPENSRRICLTRCYSTEGNANSAGGQNQIEGLEPEKPLSGNDKKKSPPSTRGARFRAEFLKRIVPCEEIDDSWDTFPYSINECEKILLKECVASHLKHKKTTRDHGGRLAPSSGRILLQTIPGSGLYREKLVRALAKEFQVPLLVLDDSSVALPYESYEESDEEGSLELDSDDEDCSSDEESSDDSDDEDDRKACVCEESKRSSSSAAEASAKPVCQFKQGDRVKYNEPSTSIEVNNRTLSRGQRGEVREVNGDKVAVVFYKTGLGTKKEKNPKPLVQWLDVKHIKHDKDAQTHDCYVAIEVLCEVLESREPIIVYFPDSFWWLSRSCSPKICKRFFRKVTDMFDQLSGRKVLICGQNFWGDESEEVQKSLKELTTGLQETSYFEWSEMHKLFTNVLCINPPKKKDEVKTFCEQIQEDWETVRLRSNVIEMQKVLKEHDLLCVDLKSVKTYGLVLNKQKAERIISWATNHHLSSCQLPYFKEDLMILPKASLYLAIRRLRKQETEKQETKDTKMKTLQSSKCPKDLATDQYEIPFVSAVVKPDEIGVKFDDVGALEEVKNALNELVILPMRRPELFSHGNLTRPCKGMLLFGPPGTGKTLIAKAVATEAGANFISITSSSLTSKWLGEEEKLTKALFSFAAKLAPVIIFVDEVDALLGARGGTTEHEATRKMRNEFMASWDGLNSKDSQRILVLGATNRPFDLDDAVVRRMPRRIYVGLPDFKNRLKILKILLAQEKLESGFSFEQLAEATENYSGSDLKNLCVAAAYKPIQDLLKAESEGYKYDGAPSIRPLKLDDFIHSKAKVVPSVANNSSSLRELREWNKQFGEGGNMI